MGPTSMLMFSQGSTACHASAVKRTGRHGVPMPKHFMFDQMIDDMGGLPSYPS